MPATDLDRRAASVRLPQHPAGAGRPPSVASRIRFNEKVGKGVDGGGYLRSDAGGVEEDRWKAGGRCPKVVVLEVVANHEDFRRSATYGLDKGGEELARRLPPAGQ